MDSTHHSTGVVRSPFSVATRPRRDSLIIACCLLGLTALAWVYLVHLGREMSARGTALTSMAAMGMAADTSGADLLLTWVMWSVMMIGMMSPSAAPVLFLFGETQSRRPEHGGRGAIVAFGLGYLAIWLGFSAAAALAQAALFQTGLLSPAMSVPSGVLPGTILIAAGIYQLTPAKSACLRHCQSPLGFLMSQWRDGAAGAFQMGVRHGVYCLGCCWAMMGVLFVVGVMNLAWVAALTGFILLERFGRAGMFAARIGGIAMLAAGVFLFVLAREPS
jgi:predicted metal-binding membrane protein